MQFIDSSLGDARYAWRMVRKHPGFTAAVTLSLALGIGANTAIFTLMDAVMWRTLPVRDPEHLLAAGIRHGEAVQTGFTYAQFRAVDDSDSMADVAGYSPAPINVSVDGNSEPSVLGHLVTGDYFQLLGVAPALGRAIGPDDDRVPDGHPVVMLSDGYWQRRFGRDPAVIGRTIRLSARPFTVIGVTPPGFFGVEIAEAPDLFVPIAMQPTVMPAFENLLGQPRMSRPWVRVIARPRADVPAPQAASAMDAGFQNHFASVNGPPASVAPAPRLELVPATTASAFRRQFSRPLTVLLALVGVVLLVACANTANLLLARAAARRPEIAMRLALGASRGRLLRQLLVESTMLAGLGGAGGLLLAHWLTQLLVAFMSEGRSPISLDLTPNARILSFTTLATAATGLLFGLAPAWRATRVDVVPALKGVRDQLSRRLTADRLLSVAQIALSLVLLVGAGLFARSFQHLNGDDPGRLRQRVILLRVEPKGSDQRGIPGMSERLDRTYQDLIRRAEEIPGVTSASMAQVTPTVPGSTSSIAVRRRSGEEVRVPQVMVYPRYFTTIGIPVTSGREFTSSDLATGAAAVCIVNASFARQVFAGEDPIGKPCQTARRPRLLDGPTERVDEPYTIVGVVADSPYNNPRGETQPLVYTTFLQTNTGRGQMVLHVRASGAPGQLVHRIREQVASVDPAAPMFDVRTLQEEMNAALGQQRLIAMLSSAFGALALLLASVGLYGLLSFSVEQRRRELGLRLALGANRRDVAVMVARDAMRLAGIGIAIGVPVALACAKVLASRFEGLLFGIEAGDRGTIGAAVLVLAAVAALAAYLPARRASRVDPMLVLRVD